MPQCVKKHRATRCCGMVDVVTEELPGYRTSSARRGRGGPSLLTAAVVVVVAIFATLAILQRNRQAAVTAATDDSAATADGLTNPDARPRRFWWSAAPSGWWLSLPRRRRAPGPRSPRRPRSLPRPQPSPTPRTSDCVTYRWSARQVFRPSAHVMVEIEAVNRCNRDLGRSNCGSKSPAGARGAGSSRCEATPSTAFARADRRSSPSGSPARSTGTTRSRSRWWTRDFEFRISNFGFRNAHPRAKCRGRPVRRRCHFQYCWALEQSSDGDTGHNVEGGSSRKSVRKRARAAEVPFTCPTTRICCSELGRSVRRAFQGTSRECRRANNVEGGSSREERAETGPCGGGAIFNIVGHSNRDVGTTTRANNVEGGSSREGRPKRRPATALPETVGWAHGGTT